MIFFHIHTHLRSTNLQRGESHPRRHYSKRSRFRSADRLLLTGKVHDTVQPSQLREGEKMPEGRIQILGPYSEN